MRKQKKLLNHYDNKAGGVRTTSYNMPSFAVMSRQCYHAYTFSDSAWRFLTEMNMDARRMKSLHNDVCSANYLSWWAEPHKFCQIEPDGYSAIIGNGNYTGANINDVGMHKV